MISLTEVRLVSRNVAIGGGVVAAICLMSSSGMGPGPLGMAATRPIAEAPYLPPGRSQIMRES